MCDQERDVAAEATLMTIAAVHGLSLHRSEYRLTVQGKEMTLGSARAALASAPKPLRCGATYREGYLSITCRELKEAERAEADWSIQMWNTIAATVRLRTSAPNPILLFRTTLDSVLMNLDDVRMWLTHYILPNLSLAVILGDSGAAERGATAALVLGDGIRVSRTEIIDRRSAPAAE